MNHPRALALVWLAVVTVGGCSTSGPYLRVPGQDPPAPSELVMYGEQNGQSMTVGDIMLCISEPGSVTVTDVAFSGAYGDVSIEAFAVRPNPATQHANLIGSTSTPLADIGDGFVVGGPQVIDAVCPTPEQFATSTSDYELAIQISRSSGSLGGGSGLIITYDSSGQRRSYTVPYAFWLCSGTQPANGEPSNFASPPPCS